MAVSQNVDAGVETDRDKPLMVSTLSTFSMVMGCASCFLLVLVFPAVLTAILAIIFGHVSAAHVRGNKAELLGLGRARIGLMLGYACLLLTAFFFPQMERGRLLVRGVLASDRSTMAKGLSEFSDGIIGDYEREVFNSEDLKGGNCPAAESLARSIRRNLKSRLIDLLEVDDAKGVSWDASQLGCHCYINSGVVCIIRVPKLIGFNDAAMEVLCLSAWSVAVESAQSIDEIGTRVPLAICVMGERRCKAFVMGETLNVDEDRHEPTYFGSDSTVVLPLFQRNPLDP